MQLENRAAIVTGGGQGIGRGIVERFVEEGARVVIAQRSPIDAELAALPGVRGLRADLIDTAAIPAVVEQAVEVLGGLDIVVNNAGIMFERSPAEITVEEWDRMIALNLRAPMFLVQAALPYLRASGSAAVVNIGSIEGYATHPEHAAYSAAKAGVHGLTRGLAIDLGPFGVRVNAIAPGWIESALSRDFLEAQPDPAVAAARLRSLHPSGRLGTGRDIGDAAVFLAGDSAAFLTGEIVTVDGGRTAKLPGF